MGLPNLLLMLSCVALTSLGQVLLKLGTNQPRSGAAGVDLLGRWVALLANPMVVLGLGFYMAATIVYLRVLSEVDLSQAYPMVALSYAITMLAGVLWLGEPLLASRVAGAALILAGVALISWR